MTFARSCSLLVLAAALAGCPQTIVTLDPDAGGDGRDAGVEGDAGMPVDAGAPEDAGEPERDAGSPDVGFEDAGEPARDAGSPVLPALRWARMTLPATIRTITTVWARSATEVYAGTATGAVLRLEGGDAWVVAWRTPSNFGVKRIRGAGDRIFVLDERNLYVFDGGLEATPATYVVANREAVDLSVFAEDDAYISGERTNDRGLFRFRGGQVAYLSNLSVASVPSVLALGAGEALVGANGRIYRYAAGGIAEEDIEFPADWSPADRSLHSFYGLARVGGELFAVGSGYAIYRREGDGVWRGAFTPGLDRELHALASFPNAAELEAYAVGRVVQGSSMLRYHGGSWSFTGPQMNLDLYDVWAASEDLYFAGGSVRSQLDGVILRGTR